MVTNRKIKTFPARILALGLIVITISICSAFILSGATPARAPAGTLDLSLSVFATGLNKPVGIANAGPSDDRLFVIEQPGVIRIVQSDGAVLPTPFLDITSRVDSSDNEEGLLGLSFHPNYANNGYFYVNYTNTSPDTRRTRISRFSVTTNPDVADPNSEDILLTIDQPFSNHNAGDLHFGPDGYMYVPLGDGGSGGDPNNNAQSLGVLLGKIIRIDVDAKPGGSPPDCQGLGSGNYTIPSSNPLMDGAGGTCDEIWATGLRNPWRFSFDRLTGDLYIGDVGQNTWEEIDFQPASSSGNENYGWRCYEGNHPYNTSGCGLISNYTFPIFEFNQNDNNCSVIGGYVYRGSQYPAMYGRYLLTDYCSGNFWDLVPNGVNWQPTKHTNLTEFGYVAFGEDANGELYVANISTGNIYHLEENSPPAPILSINKSGPTQASAGSLITYTLTITNSGNLTATNLVVTDTIPTGAHYIPGSGGVQVGSIVSWTIDDLEPHNTVRQTFAVTATQTIINSDYRVSASSGAIAIGNVSVTTIIEKKSVLADHSEIGIRIVSQSVLFHRFFLSKLARRDLLWVFLYMGQE